MTLTGKQKAALLLMNLDAATAGELLKGIDTSTVQDLAVELTYLDVAGHCNIANSIETAREFCDNLHVTETFQVKDFLNELLNNTVGKDQSQQIQSQIGDLLRKKDPFMPIRSASVESLAPILQQQHPQVIAMVLSELSPKKSSDVLNLLSEETRAASISRMAVKDIITKDAKTRIAQMIASRLDESSDDSQGPSDQPDSSQSYRKIAVILRNLAKEIRDGMVAAIRQKDAEAADIISNLMVTWQDIARVADRSLQNGLRGLDSQALALALTEAEDAIQTKIKSNISTRAAETLEEEMSLMSKPKQDEINQAREQIVESLRKLNEAGELEFIEE